MRFVSIIFITLVFSFLPGYVQSDSSDNSDSGINLWQLVTGSFAEPEEQVVHRKPVGPYEMTVVAHNFVQSGYLEFYVVADGEGLGEESSVELSAQFLHARGLESPDNAPQSNTEPVNAPKGSVVEAQAEYQRGIFKAESLAFDAPGMWDVQVNIEGAQGTASTNFRLWVYPIRTEPGLAFVLTSVGLPFVLLLFALAIIRSRRLPLFTDRLATSS